MSQDPLLGHVLGGARLQQRVSKGLLAGVYRGHYERLGIPVAVKVLTPKAMTQGMNKERFIREGRALAQLSHPNIIKIYNVGHEQGRYFIIMDWIQDGMNLRQLAASRPLTPAQSLKVVQRLCEALDYIHQKGLIHRDIKPANVCLRRGGHPVLMDFSLIKDENADVQLTAPGTIMGTVNFMPPEQAQPGGPFGNVNPRSDVYSLGGTLFWLLTGKPPFKGRTPMETIIKLMREPPEPPSKYNPTIPPSVDQLVLRTLSKTQDQRPKDARDLINQIEQIFQSERDALQAAQRPPLADTGSGRQASAVAAPAAAPASAPPQQPWGSSPDNPESPSVPALAHAGQTQPAAAAQQRAVAPDPRPATGSQPAVAPQPEAPEPAVSVPVVEEEPVVGPGDGGAFSPTHSTEAAAAGQLKLPRELLTEPPRKRTNFAVVIAAVLLVLASFSGIGIFVWVVVFDRTLF